MTSITFGSVCSGIESVSVAVDPLKWQAAWFAEIEAFPAAVLAHRFPDTPNHGDMTKLPGMVLRGEIPAPDVMVGGTPCQAFSVAGMRKGLEDARGQLSIKFVELADAIDHVRAARGEPECVVWWENVPGVLSDKGNAFGCFLAALVGESDALQPSGGRWTDAGCVYGTKRSAAWRVLDAQYFGLAQRRRRVFVVASSRAGFDPAAVLFESEGVRRDSAPSREKGEEVAGTLNARTDGGGFPGTDEAYSGYVQPVTCMAHGQGGAEIAENRSPTLTCNHEAPIVVHGTQDPCVSKGLAHTLGRNSGQENAVFAIQAGALRTNPNSGPDGVGVQADHAYTLEARAEVQADCVTGEVTHTLKAEGFDGSEDGTGRGQPIVAAFAENSRQELRYCNGDGSITGALSTGGGKAGQSFPAAQVGSAVRRLTPIECERLQGFPDSWTQIPWRNKPAEECPDGPRYKAIGNSKAVPVVRWIARRIQTCIERST